MSARTVVLVAAAVLAAAVVLALPLYVLNPTGTDAVANGKLIVAGDSDRAPLNLKLLSADPSAPANDDLWCVLTAPRHCCFRAGGTSYCWNATSTP